MATRGTKEQFLRVPGHIGEKARQQAERALANHATSVVEERGVATERVVHTLSGGGVSLETDAAKGLQANGLQNEKSNAAEQTMFYSESFNRGNPKNSVTVEGTVAEEVVEGELFEVRESRLPYAHRRVWADSVLRTERAFRRLAAEARASSPQRWKRNQIARAAGIRSAQTLDEAVRVLIGLGFVRRRSLRGPQGAEFELSDVEVEPRELARRLAVRLRELAERIERLEPEAWRERAVTQVIERVASALAVFEETPQLVEGTLRD